MYKIRDLQFEYRYFADEAVFKTKKEIIEQLIDYHNIDFEDEKYKTLREYINTFKNTKEKLNAILNYGAWEIEIV